MKQVIMKDGTEQTVTDNQAKRLVYYKEAELKGAKAKKDAPAPEKDQPKATKVIETLQADKKEEKKTPANKADKTKKETK